MNIFENYSKEIRLLVFNHKDELNLKELNNFKGMTVENPPIAFNFDLSCNVGLILGKINKLNPKNFYSSIKTFTEKQLLCKKKRQKKTSILSNSDTALYKKINSEKSVF